jgi:hypothetical protein
MYNSPYGWYFMYLKKEDAKMVLMRRGRAAAIIGAMIAITFAILQFFVSPKLISLYDEFGYTLPIYSAPAARVAVLVLALFVLFSLKPESEKAIDAKLKKYKSGEMILMSRLTNYRYEYSVIAVLLAVVMYMIFSIVLPIYNITSQI